MKISEGVEAAVHCATLLANVEDGRTLPASALAEYHGVSPSYLVKHLKALVDANILESTSGPHGGYRLLRKPDAISLLDIVLAVEGPEPAFRCTDIRKRGPCALDASAYVKPCAINAAMLKAESVYRAALAEAKLSDLIATYRSEGDPRSIAAGSAYVAQHQRP